MLRQKTRAAFEAAGCLTYISLQERCAQLEKERAELLSHVDVTPERCRADKQLLQAHARKCALRPACALVAALLTYFHHPYGATRSCMCTMVGHFMCCRCAGQ